MVNVNWPTAVVGEADSVSSASASACHIGGPIDVNPGELPLVYGILVFTQLWLNSSDLFKVSKMNSILSPFVRH